MSCSCIAEGAKNGIFAFQDFMDSSMESQGVDDFGTIQEDAVKLIGVVGDKGGIDGRGRGDRCFFWGNRIVAGFL